MDGWRIVVRDRLKRAELADLVWCLASVVLAGIGQASELRSYYVTGAEGSGQVEAWSGYPLQFGGQRRFAWQDEMAADLRRALAGLPRLAR
jgi:hypothetical protein